MSNIKQTPAGRTVVNTVSDKNPEHEFENPAPMPDNHLSQNKPKHHDLQGQQGGQKGGAKEPL